MADAGLQDASRNRLKSIPPKPLLSDTFQLKKSLKRVLPWLVVERPDLWQAYQRIQWEPLEKAMKRGRYIASFIGQDPTFATFAGMYRIGEWEVP